jgi:hypothetical protein
MLVMHKVNRVLPSTPDLDKMVRAFDRHDSFDVAWAGKELGMEAVFGPGCHEWLADLAVERGLAVRKKGKVYRK